MRVLHVNYEYPGVTENCGGGGRVTHLLHTHLKARGHESRVVTDPADRHYATFPARSYRRIDAAIREFDPDVIHGHFSLPTSLFLPRLVRKHDRPLVVSVMGADIYDPTRFQLVRPLADRANQYILDAADAVAASCRDMRERVERAFGTDCRVYPYGVRPDSYTPAEPRLHDPVRVLSVGRLVERKNYQTATESIRELRARGIDATYRIVGTGPLASQLADLADRYDWLTLPGYVEDIRREYARADVFYLPSVYESFGVVYLEALASGLPVVATDRGGPADFVTPRVGRLVADPSSPTPLADALQATIQRYNSLQPEARPFVRDAYTVDAMTANYETCYQEVT